METPQSVGGIHAESVPAVAPRRRRRPYKRRTRIEIDMRTRWSKRRLQLIEQFTADLGRVPSVRDNLLIANAAAVACRIEQLNGKITRAEDVDDESMVRLSNTLARLLALLGLRSTSQRTTPTLEQYLANKNGEVE